MVAKEVAVMTLADGPGRQKLQGLGIAMRQELPQLLVPAPTGIVRLKHRAARTP